MTVSLCVPSEKKPARHRHSGRESRQRVCQTFPCGECPDPFQHSVQTFFSPSQVTGWLRMRKIPSPNPGGIPTVQGQLPAGTCPANQDEGSIATCIPEIPAFPNSVSAQTPLVGGQTSRQNKPTTAGKDRLLASPKHAEEPRKSMPKNNSKRCTPRLDGGSSFR